MTMKMADEICTAFGVSKTLVENAERRKKRQRIAEMTDFLNKQSTQVEYDERLVKAAY